jgi:tetratricopeptide (TPR) repeat protein
MLLYANIGDLRGNPNMNNMGDRKGAVESFSKTLAIARGIYEADPADQRARSDYATALARMAVVQAPEDVQTKIQMLRQAIDLQTQISAENLFVRADLVSSHLMLGDTYQAQGDEQNALRCYRQGALLAEQLVESGQPVQLARAIALYRRLGLAAARGGDRKTALEYGHKIVETSKPRTDNKWPADAHRTLQARASAAKGMIHSAIGGARDREEARTWLSRALSLYREMESQPTFPAEYRADMKLVEGELGRLK